MLNYGFSVQRGVNQTLTLRDWSVTSQLILSREAAVVQRAAPKPIIRSKPLILDGAILVENGWELLVDQRQDIP